MQNVTITPSSSALSRLSVSQPVRIAARQERKPIIRLSDVRTVLYLYNLCIKRNRQRRRAYQPLVRRLIRGVGWLVECMSDTVERFVLINRN